MRVFHIKSTDCTLEAENRFADMVSAFAGLGINQHVLMSPDQYLEDLFKAQDIAFNTQKFSGLFDLRTQQAAQQIIESYGPHIIQTHSPGSASVISKIRNDAVRISFADEDREQNRKTRTNNGITLSICYPQHGAPLDYDLLPVPPLVINHATNDQPVLKAALNTPEDKPLVGTMLDLESAYDVDKVFAAIREIPDLHFLIIGKEGNRTELDNKARKQAVHDRVRFIEDHHNWPALLKALDICIVPHRDRGIDRLTLEGWSCGACILSAMPATLSPVTDGEDGILVSGNDALKWRTAIKEIVANEDLRKTLGQRGLAKYKNAYDPARIVRQYLQAYETALRIKT